MPNGHKTDRHYPLQDPPKFNQIGIFGLKTYHLATQLEMFSGCFGNNTFVCSCGRHKKS
jgi:hypothetical protein